jgi:very-short-patch-repair endonuclease
MERKMFFGAYPEIFEIAKNLRNNMTPAEKRLWEELRLNKLGVRFKPQHPMQFFIADFYCYALKLVIEVDGPIHDINREKDLQRTAALEELGNVVIRFTNNEVMNNLEVVLSQIKTKIQELKSAIQLSRHDDCDDKETHCQ